MQARDQNNLNEREGNLSFQCDRCGNATRQLSFENGETLCSACDLEAEEEHYQEEDNYPDEGKVH